MNSPAFSPHINESACTFGYLAVGAANSQGRIYREAGPSYRSEFQRDRDRVIHSSAFRRLEYKTQVFANHEGDMFRTRLTHSLEVAQVARTIARALGVNEDLTEAIALAHDLGHTPFGHAGQQALNACMKPWGGFEHNHQSLRVVDHLEHRYIEFNGLNLLYETREGILKHCNQTRALEFGSLGQRFIHGWAPCLEAQIANLADEIAYNHHDIDDGLRAGLLNHQLLIENTFYQSTFSGVKEKHPTGDEVVIIHMVLREMLSVFINDLIENSKQNLNNASVHSIEEVRRHGHYLIGFSTPVLELHQLLKQMLFNKLYRHQRVIDNNERAKKVVRDLFNCFSEKPELMNDKYTANPINDEHTKMIAIADYIAGMTDRYAFSSHCEFFGRN